MILCSHALVGGAVASTIPSHPAAALLIGFASHFILDAIPHADYPIRSRSVNPEIGARMVLDAALDYPIRSRSVNPEIGAPMVLDAALRWASSQLP
jgi:hypothetical protein